MTLKIATFLTLTAFTTLCVALGYAQGNPSPKLERLIAKLQLSEEQIPQFTHIMQSHQQARKANRDASREKRKAMFDALTLELGNVLNNDQLEQFKESARRHRKHNAEKHSGRGDCREHNTANS